PPRDAAPSRGTFVLEDARETDEFQVPPTPPFRSWRPILDRSPDSDIESGSKSGDGGSVAPITIGFRQFPRARVRSWVAAGASRLSWSPLGGKVLAVGVAAVVVITLGQLMAAVGGDDRTGEGSSVAPLSADTGQSAISSGDGSASGRSGSSGAARTTGEITGPDGSGLEAGGASTSGNDWKLDLATVYQLGLADRGDESDGSDIGPFDGDQQERTSSGAEDEAGTGLDDREGSAANDGPSPDGGPSPTSASPSTVVTGTEPPAALTPAPSTSTVPPTTRPLLPWPFPPSTSPPTNPDRPAPSIGEGRPETTRPRPTWPEPTRPEPRHPVDPPTTSRSDTRPMTPGPPTVSPGQGRGRSSTPAATAPGRADAADWSAPGQ
ncbi:MAG: hypothetical protein OER95_07875, partial [Acidimicrobiia bacterium]|nr:hypothetical protein [Acidimicrobiia bacterium]